LSASETIVPSPLLHLRLCPWLLLRRLFPRCWLGGWNFLHICRRRLSSCIRNRPGISRSSHPGTCSSNGGLCTRIRRNRSSSTGGSGRASRSSRIGCSGRYSITGGSWVGTSNCRAIGTSPRSRGRCSRPRTGRGSKGSPGVGCSPVGSSRGGTGRGVSGSRSGPDSSGGGIIRSTRSTGRRSSSAGGSSGASRSSRIGSSSRYIRSPRRICASFPPSALVVLAAPRPFGSKGSPGVGGSLVGSSSGGTGRGVSGSRSGPDSSGGGIIRSTRSPGRRSSSAGGSSGASRSSRIGSSSRYIIISGCRTSSKCCHVLLAAFALLFPLLPWLFFLLPVLAVAPPHVPQLLPLYCVPLEPIRHVML